MIENNEAYFTPIPVVESFLRKAFPTGLQGMTVLDPCVGTGNVLQACIAHGCGRVYGYDIDPELVAYCERRFAHAPVRADFRVGDCRKLDEPVNLVITNPPFSLGFDVATRFISRYPGQQLALLLRLAFLETPLRAELHRACPSDMYVLTRRVQYLVLREGRMVPKLNKDGKNGVDQWAYSWFHWSRAPGGKWSLLDIPARAEQVRMAEDAA